jgi:hypothetical protein
MLVADSSGVEGEHAHNCCTTGIRRPVRRWHKQELTLLDTTLDTGTLFLPFAVAFLRLWTQASALLKTLAPTTLTLASLRWHQFVGCRCTMLWNTHFSRPQQPRAPDLAPRCRI